jgi:hypothetical protein
LHEVLRSLGKTQLGYIRKKTMNNPFTGRLLTGTMAAGFRLRTNFEHHAVPYEIFSLFFPSWARRRLNWNGVEWFGDGSGRD